MKKKHALLAAGGAAFAIMIGVSYAVDHDLMNFANSFQTGVDVIEFKETFDSPDNWQPCQEIPKTVVATNKNSTNRYVRLKFSEYWRVKDSLISNDDHETSDLALTWTDDNGEHSYAIVNLQNENDWKLKADGWYYYKHALGENESARSLLKSVTFNCGANLSGEATYSADGLSGESQPTDYAGANFHVYVIGEMSSQEWDLTDRSLYSEITERDNNGLDTNIDFKNKASATNGTGINIIASTAEDEFPVYYFRGGVSDNHVIWGDYCWKILRTTNTGGIKMTYNGTPTGEGDARQCSTVGSAVLIDDGSDMQTKPFNNAHTSPADIGYMYGDRIEWSSMQAGSSNYVFSNKVSRNGNTYTLDTSNGQSISGTWNSVRETAITRYHYFCKNGATSCDSTQIAYLLVGKENVYIYHLPLGGYDDIDDARTKMFANEHDSNVKTTIDTWFEASNLDEDDLEDTVFCNDRSIVRGTLRGENYTTENDGLYFGVSGRSTLDSANPTLACAKNDSFTKDDTVNGNGALKHKIALITGDESVYAGISVSISDSSNFLALSNTWTMSPYYMNQYGAYMYRLSTNMGGSKVTSLERYVRPVVSLKHNKGFVAGGEGTTNKPYIIE